MNRRIAILTFTRRGISGGRLGVLAGTAILVGCGGGGSGTTTNGGTTVTGHPALACPSGKELTRSDPGGDVRVVSSQRPDRPGRSPSADLLSAAVRRGQGGIVCVTFRTAGPIRLGSSFAISTRQAAAVAGSFDEERYEIQLTPDGEVNVSRPHGEPRYPVRADVERRGDVLSVAMETLLRPDRGLGWRVDSSYLPDFPLGEMYVDAIPNAGGWLRLPASPGP